MKSEHRHELKTNELAEWLSNLPQWAKENLKTIIYVSIVIFLVVASALFHWYRKNVESARKQLELTNLINQLPPSKIQILEAQAKGIDISYMLIQLANNLQATATDAKNDQMAALALIKQAETLRTELHYRPGTVSPAELEAAINQAKDAYNEAIQKSSTNPSLMAKAEFGLGLCEEELGNFEIAEQTYRDVATNTRFEDTVAAAEAKHRLKIMADYQQKLVFRPSPKPAPTKPLQPQIELKVPEDSEPNFQTQEETPEVLDINLAPLQSGEAIKQ